MFALTRAARTVARQLTLDRQLDFWMQELDPTWSADGVRACVIEVVDETPDVRTFRLAPNARWGGHRAGQFVTVEVEIDGVRTRRCYSLSSAPGDERLAITVKRVAGGRVSSWMHDHLRPGHVIGLGGATGGFVLPAEPSKLLLLSGGSGATPCMSILRDLARRAALTDVVFVHAARSRRDVLFRRELEALASRHAGLRVLFVLDEDGRRLDAEQLRSAVPDLAERATMLCGPPGMMAALAPIWSAPGLAHRLHVERFAPVARRSPLGAAPSARVALTLLSSGRTVVTERSGTLLEQLELAGERPRSGCRMGICRECACRLRSGSVEDVVTGAVTDGPDQQIRLCVSRARTDLELAI